MSLSELKVLLVADKAGLRVIDIRSAQEYGKLHIPVAENIPAELLNTESLPFSKSDLIVCVCNKGHERSQDAAALLLNNGFENSYYLEGGMQGWFAEQ